MYFIYFFFFKQKTAYEMRISDWSSDVCSSDLLRQHVFLVDRIGRILLLHLRQHELHEIARIERGKRSFGRGRGTRRRACRGYGSDGHFILIVSSISCLAVDMASTRFWYWREASSISTRSEEHTSELQSLM